MQVTIPQKASGKQVLPVKDSVAEMQMTGSVNRATKEKYRLGSGDEIEIKFYYNNELNEKVIIRPDGRIALQLIGELDVAGLSSEELSQELYTRYAKHKRNLDITVIIRTFSSQQVFVGGEVSRPGSVLTYGRLTATHAIIAAGGFRDTAQISTVVLLRKGPDAKPIFMVLNLKESLEGKVYGDVLLKPYDVLFVPKTQVSRMNQYVRQYVTDMLPFEVTTGYSWLKAR